jgi:hypothetical protein
MLFFAMVFPLYVSFLEKLDLLFGRRPYNRRDAEVAGKPFSVLERTHTKLARYDSGLGLELLRVLCDSAVRIFYAGRISGASPLYTRPIPRTRWRIGNSPVALAKKISPTLVPR